MVCVATGDIGKRIRDVRLSLKPAKMGQTDLAKRLGVSQGRLSNWERGEHDPPQEIVARAARELGVSIQYLLGSSAREVSDPLYPVSFPVVSLRYGGMVPAGDWADPMDSEDFVEVDAKFDGLGRFACRVEGDSMYPLLEPDDLAIFQMYNDFRRAKINDIILARRTHDNSITVKRLVHDGQNFALRSINSAHEDPIAPQWESVGFLIGIVRKRGTYTRSDYNPDGIRLSDTN